MERETFQPRVMLWTQESDRNAGYDFLEVERWDMTKKRLEGSLGHGEPQSQAKEVGHFAIDHQDLRDS